MPSGESTRKNRRYWDSIAQSNWEEKAGLHKKIKEGLPYLKARELVSIV